jgi:sulfite reductase (NADPH) flavoprotein alpha-component
MHAARVRQQDKVIDVLKKTLFQLHWFFGITAGLVLALMGITGALYSFQEELLRVQCRCAQGRSARRRRAAAGRTGAAGRSPATRQSVDAVGRHARRQRRTDLLHPAPGERRGELRYADPYTGELKGEVAGQGFFNLMLNCTASSPWAIPAGRSPAPAP